MTSAFTQPLLGRGAFFLATTSFALGAVTAAISVAWVSNRLARKQPSSSFTDSGEFKPPDHRDGQVGNQTEKDARPSSLLDSHQHKTSNADTLIDSVDLDLRLIRKAEAVIQARSNLIVVVERCTNDHNYSAILRTAEALGIQHVWIIDPNAIVANVVLPEESSHDESMIRSQKNTFPKLTPEEVEQKRKHRLFAQNATEWLDLREFATTSECIEALRDQKYQIWTTDLSQEAVCLTQPDLTACGAFPLPPKLAVVFGTEAVGVSQEMLDRADLRVYLPLRGFADSLNLSVATALVLHQVFHLQPSLIGNTAKDEQTRLRKLWFPKLATQRLLTSNSKKYRKKLQAQLHTCDALQAKLDVGESLTKEQVEKLHKRSEYEATLHDIEQRAGFGLAESTVADLIAHPPAPLTDLRRCDEHRVSFVGRNTRKLHEEHWKGMAATANLPSKKYSTSQWFRDRLASLSSSTDKNGI